MHFLPHPVKIYWFIEIVVNQTDFKIYQSLNLKK